MKTLEKNSASSTFTIAGKKVTTVGTAVICASALAIAPTVQPPPPRLVPAVQLTAAVASSVGQPSAQVSNVLGALLTLDLKEFIVPPSAGQPAPSRPTAPTPQSTGFEFEDLIINTYHAIEPWVRYGFEIATYAVGWVPWVGWLSPQIMIFYNFGERIVESLVVNSANWLWGPLPFGEGLRNVARDSWDALVQLGIDQWNFWLPPLPPLPFTAGQAQATLAAEESLTPAQQSAAPSTGRPHPLRDALAALRGVVSDPTANAPQRFSRGRRRWTSDALFCKARRSRIRAMRRRPTSRPRIRLTPRPEELRRCPAREPVRLPIPRARHPGCRRSLPLGHRRTAPPPTRPRSAPARASGTGNRIAAREHGEWKSGLHLADHPGLPVTE